MPANPSGDPTATTCCPTARVAELPIARGVRVDWWAILITAISEDGSRPTIVAGADVPSCKVTVSFPAPTPAPAPAAGATTWLLVRIKPSADNTTPEPSSLCLPVITWICTTLGSTLAATCCTDPSGIAGESRLCVEDPAAVRSC